MINFKTTYRPSFLYDNRRAKNCFVLLVLLFGQVLSVAAQQQIIPLYNNENEGESLTENEKLMVGIDNVLLTDTTLDIIDYEFAGYNDPGYDFGRVIAGLEYEADEPKILDILEAYFGRPATEKEHLHWMAYSAIHNWYYVGWALYKESINESSRDWMLFFFKQTKKLASWCLPRYEAMYGKID